MNNSYPWYAPLFWHGMPSGIWLGLLRQGQFAAWPRRWHFAASVSFFSSLNSTLAATQRLTHGRAIEQTKLVAPPVFVLGHWRSGTTLLHELLQLDERFDSPTTFQCFAPWHFFLTEGSMQRFGNFLLPSKRPMDNMRAGWRLPQEDEFALMNLGAPTTYTQIAFPNKAVDLTPLTPQVDADGSWRERFLWFLKAVTLRTGKRLILKSPPHTGRLSLLCQLLPGAKFVHIARDPREMIPSTIRLWQSLSKVQSLQHRWDDDAARRFVFDSFETMYEAYIPAADDLIRSSAGQLCEIRFEDLTADPVACVREIYQQLDLGEFDAVAPAVESRMAADRDYQRNRWEPEAELVAEIDARSQRYRQRFGYPAPAHAG